MDAYNYQWISETILKSDFYKVHAYKDIWTSGSSTAVHPITIYGQSPLREIDILIQLDWRATKNRYERFRRLMSRLRTKYPRMDGRFVKRDGSCPDCYEISVWGKGYQPRRNKR